MCVGTGVIRPHWCLVAQQLYGSVSKIVQAGCTKPYDGSGQPERMGAVLDWCHETVREMP